MEELWMVVEKRKVLEAFGASSYSEPGMVISIEPLDDGIFQIKLEKPNFLGQYEAHRFDDGSYGIYLSEKELDDDSSSCVR